MELKVAKYHNAAGETAYCNKSIISSLDAALAGAKIGAGGGGTLKVVIRKHELKQVLELIKRSGSGKKAAARPPHQIMPRTAMPWPSAEQRLNLLRRRKLSRGGGIARGSIGRCPCPWQPTLQSIPEE